MPTILVPDDSQVIADGKLYTPKGGEIVVDEEHVAAILGAVQGSSLKPEAPDKTKAEAPPKEK